MSFGITPASGWPPPVADDFPNFIQFQEDGVNLGGPDADTVNFTGSVSATRGEGENSNIITVDVVGGGSGGGGAVAIGLTMPEGVFNVAGSPAGDGDTFDVTFDNQFGGSFFAGPNALSPAGTPAFRVIAGSDLPSPLWTSRADGYDLTYFDRYQGSSYNSGSPGSFVVLPSLLSDDFVGGAFLLYQAGAGALTIVAGDGSVNIRVRAGLTATLAGQYATATLIWLANNEWVLCGDLAAA